MSVVKRDVVAIKQQQHTYQGKFCYLYSTALLLSLRDWESAGRGICRAQTRDILSDVTVT